ncbi:unnamed protein product [Cuscuta epithymum]|uniref:CCHC-type domain-containing protein n=1 Tax=Cuscuta epithymum TaxID=186058 RepID=A0AAV0ENC2_9ASTE|nr:unnamed protein product [Cuscuta epithymum]CAH9124104.1 unnamed protein product [Cuscuta epithymum]
MTCSICKQKGHNKTICPTLGQSVRAGGHGKGGRGGRGDRGGRGTTSISYTTRDEELVE